MRISPKSTPCWTEFAREQEVRRAIRQWEKRLPVTVGQFMDQLERGQAAPLMGTWLRRLAEPGGAAGFHPDIKDAGHDQDKFLGVYSNSVSAFLKTVTPLFETIWACTCSLIEFLTPKRCPLPDAMKPQLVIATPICRSFPDPAQRTEEVIFDRRAPSLPTSSATPSRS